MSEKPTRRDAFIAMWDEMQEGFAELLANGWDPSTSREIIERELGPLQERRRAA